MEVLDHGEDVAIACVNRSKEIEPVAAVHHLSPGLGCSESEYLHLKLSCDMGSPPA